MTGVFATANLWEHYDDHPTFLPALQQPPDLLRLMLSRNRPLIAVALNEQYLVLEPIERREGPEPTFVAYEIVVDISHRSRRNDIYLVSYGAQPTVARVRDLRPEAVPEHPIARDHWFMEDGDTYTNVFDFRRLLHYAEEIARMPDAAKAANLAVENWASAHLLYWSQLKSTLLVLLGEVFDGGTRLEAFLHDGFRARLEALPAEADQIDDAAKQQYKNLLVQILDLTLNHRG